MTRRAGDRLYPHLPAWAQNLGISLVALRYRWNRLGPGFAPAVESFAERDRWSAERMTAFVEEQLRLRLLHAYETVPYYRERWSRAGLCASDLAGLGITGLHRIPTTPKLDLRDHPDELLSETAPAPRHLLTNFTSGSTGMPTKTYCTRDDMRTFTAAREARSYAWAGVSLGMPRSTIGSRPVVPRTEQRPPFYRYNYTERQIYLSVYHMSQANVADYVQGLNRYRPKVLTGYAHAHYVLARLMLHAGIGLRYVPRAAIMSAEKLTPSMRSTIERAFGTRAYEEYGSVENCVLATECEAGSLHVSSDFGILEVVDDSGRPVPPGTSGRIVCTGLINQVQPLIRYEIGDLGIISPIPCPCGRDQFPRLEAVVGRERDSIVMRDGRLVQTSVTPLFKDMPHLVEAQVVQQDYTDFVIKVVVDAGFGDAEERTLIERLQRLVGEAQVRVERCSAIERTAAGKFPSIVSLLSERE